MSEPDTRPPEERISSELGERVRAIVASAENMAAAIRRDAEQDAQNRRRETEAEAQRYLDEARRRADELVAERVRRMSELSDLIMERTESILERLDQAEAVKAQLEQLVRALGATATRVANDAGGEEQAPEAPLELPQDQAELSPDELDTARLVALQMAVAGAARDEVETHLARDLGIADPRPVVEDVFSGR
ncbi:MAG: hypothetical protein ACJ76V_13690 [Thermoleophilaceae bacterium]